MLRRCLASCSAFSGRRNAFVAAFLLAAAGCGSGPSEPLYAPAERLAGTWRWVASLDVRTQAVHTPATAGYQATLRFTPESPRGGTFTYARDGGVPLTGRFDIASEDAPGNDFIVLTSGIDFLRRNAWLSVGTDSLQLGGVMELGYNSRYARLVQ